MIHDRWSDGTTPHEPIATIVWLIRATSMTSVYSFAACVLSTSAGVQVAPSALVQMPARCVSPSRTPPTATHVPSRYSTPFTCAVGSMPLPGVHATVIGPASTLGSGVAVGSAVGSADGDADGSADGDAEADALARHSATRSAPDHPTRRGR